MIQNDIMLILDRDDDLFGEMSARGRVDVKRAYDTKSQLLKVLRRLHLISGMPFFHIWNGAWKKELGAYKTVIIHASKLKAPIIQYIHSRYPDIRVILWYWNPVATSLNPDTIPDSHCEKWSFDATDCKKYNMRYNTQFFFKDIKIDSDEILQDVFFAGKDKGRFDKLVGYEDAFKSHDVSTLFMIMANSSKMKHLTDKYSPYISYNQILSHISKSKAILDVIDNRQSGLTLRPMESIFFEKKLITNHTAIEDYDFYNPNNIFILGKDNLDRLKEFIDSPYEKLADGIVANYSFESWLERFKV